MGWWTLTYLDNNRAQTHLIVLAATNHPAHLFMHWATWEPRRRPIYRNVRGKQVFCGWRYIWDTPNLVEQSQPLDTFQHTFVTTPVLPHNHIWYYLWSPGAYPDKYCQSPLIHVPPPEIEMASARIFHDADQWIPSGVPTPVTFNSVLWDDYNFYDPAEPTRLTCPAGALYQVGCCITLGNFFDPSARIYIRRSGQDPVVQHSHSQHGLEWGGCSFTMNTLMRFQPTDYLRVYVEHWAGINVNVLGLIDFSPHFWIRLVGAYPI